MSGDKIIRLETYYEILLTLVEKNESVKKSVLCQNCGISYHELNRHLFEMGKFGLIDLDTIAPTKKGISYVSDVTKPRSAISKIRKNYLSK